MGNCLHCGKEVPYAHNYCNNTTCLFDAARANGAVEYLPNGLPIRCITRDEGPGEEYNGIFIEMNNETGVIQIAVSDTSHTGEFSFSPDKESFEVVSNLIDALTSWVLMGRDKINLTYMVERLESMVRFYKNRERLSTDTDTLSFSEYVITVAPREDEVKTLHKMRHLSQYNVAKLMELGYIVPQQNGRVLDIMASRQVILARELIAEGEKNEG